MIPIALETHTFWLITLGIGAVVALVVIVLMTLLLSLLKDIDAGVASASTWPGASQPIPSRSSSCQPRRRCSGTYERKP